MKPKSIRNVISRRHFIRRTALAATAIGTVPSLKALGYRSPNEHVYVEKPLTRTSWEARLLTQAAEKHKVTTQMGNQGYSHDATRVACEIVWSGEIGEVREVHAWTGRRSWPQGMTKIPPPTPVPETLDWDLWLGGAAWRPYTAGDDEYRAFVAEHNSRGGRGRGRGGRAGSPDGASGVTNAPAAGGRGGRGGGGGFGGGGFGFYLSFNWRGFYDFGSSLIGDWGVHILGPANWALQLSPASLVSVERIKKDSSPPFTFPDELAIRYEFAARGSMPPVTVYWYHHAGGDAYLPPGMTADEARKIPETGPKSAPLDVAALEADAVDSEEEAAATAAKPGAAMRLARAKAPRRRHEASPPDRADVAASPVAEAAGTTASLSDRRDIWAPVGAAKESACCRVHAGRNISFQGPT